MKTEKHIRFSPTKEQWDEEAEALAEHQELLRSKTFVNPKFNKRYADTKIRPPTQTTNKSFRN